MKNKKLLNELLLLIISNETVMKREFNKPVKVVPTEKIKTWCRLNDINWPDELPF